MYVKCRKCNVENNVSYLSKKFRCYLCLTENKIDRKSKKENTKNLGVF